MSPGEAEDFREGSAAIVSGSIERVLGRTFSDFRKWVEAHAGGNVWKYDPVEGKKGVRKAILALTFPELRFHFGYLISKGGAASAMSRIRALMKVLGADYAGIFQVNLSDIGMEFSDFQALEEYGARMFVANPYRSTEKAPARETTSSSGTPSPKGEGSTGSPRRRWSCSPPTSTYMSGNRTKTKPPTT